MDDSAPLMHADWIRYFQALQNAIEQPFSIGQISLSTARLLGRTTAGTGPAEQISVAGSLTLSGGVLTGTGTVVTPDPLTTANDTNVTIAASGTPATALLEPVLLTLGWTGLLAVARGGIGVGTLASNGVLYGNGTGAVQALAVNAGTKLFLTQTSSAAPAWSAIVAGDVPTLNQSTTGSAGTLSPGRNINGTLFDGSANITIAAAAGTLTGTTLAATVVTSSLTTVGALDAGSITSNFGSINVGTDAITGGAISGTTGAFSGLLSANGGLLINGGSFAAGRLYKSATLGMVLSGITGSGSDLAFIKPDGSATVFTIPTGTANTYFAADTLALIDSGRLGIGAVLGNMPGTGTNLIIFGDGTVPASMSSNTAGLYANDVGGTVQMFAISEAGVSTQLTFAAPQTYTETNVTTDRAFNANATTMDELADVLGTLIVDLRARGIVA